MMCYVRKRLRFYYTDKYRFLYSIFLLIIPQILFSQLPNPSRYSNNNNAQTIIQQQNQQSMQRMGVITPNNASGNSNKYSEEIQGEQLHQILKEETQVYKKPERKYNGRYRFSDHNSVEFKQGITFYENAFNGIIKMLEGDTSLDLKKAIFLTENSILKDAISYEEFTGKIDELLYLIQQVAHQENLKLDNSISTHYIIQKLYTDTIFLKETGEIFYPFSYDFKDIFGDENYVQTLVSKLLYTGKGQCKSMPLLYSILAQELNAESYLSFSPNHSFIKFKDQFGTWYNFETTAGMLVSDSWITGSGFVKSEAIKSRTYTEPIATKEILAHLLVELAINFSMEFGADLQYMGKYIDKAIQYFPNDIFAWMMKSNLKTAEVDKSLWSVNYPDMDQLSKYPIQNKLLLELKKLYSKVDNMGYSEMPEAAYISWLESLEEEKKKQEEKANIIHLNKSR